MRPQDVHVLEGDRIVEDGIGHHLSVLKGLRRHDSEGERASVLPHEGDDLVCGPPGPIVGVVRLVLDRDRIELNPVVSHKVVEVGEVAGVGRIGVRPHVLLPVDGGRHIGRRIPWRGEDQEPEFLGALSRCHLTTPVIGIFTDEDAKHGEPKLVRAVAERRLPLLTREISDPKRMVDPAESSDQLLFVVEVHGGGLGECLSRKASQK